MEQIDLIERQSEFIKSLQSAGKSLNTIKNYKTDLNIYNKFLTQKGRPLMINEVTLGELKDYSRFLEAKYNSPNSIRRRVQALRIFFDFLIQERFIDENPIKKIVVSPKVVDKPNPVTFIRVKMLKDYLEQNFTNSQGHEKLLQARNMVLFYFVYGAGLKVSTIERLKMNQIIQNEGAYRILVTPEKRDPYTVTLPPQFSSVFETYQDLLAEGKERDHIEFAQVFFNANPFKILSGGLSARGIEIIFKDLAKQLEFQLTARSLRQACIFKWLCQGVTQSRIKEWMGVQPQYSLKPFIELLQESPDKFAYLEV